MTSTEQQDGAPAEPERPLLGPVVKRRRRSSVPDPVLAEAVETARGGVLEITDAATIGTAHQMRVEEDRLLTHLFECLLPGYRGWFWYSTVARAPRAKTVTVCEVGLLPGEDALLAPDWVPWADRVRPEELDQDKAEESEDGAEEGEHDDAASAGEAPASEEKASEDSSSAGTASEAAASDEAPEAAPAPSGEPDEETSAEAESDAEPVSEESASTTRTGDDAPPSRV